ncbi:MAG TPA: nucleotidyltransferase family protein [Candidatus Acidoferrum sp.]
MADSHSKRAILAALRHDPDFSGLDSLPPLHSTAGRNCIRWLDRGGLALILLRALQNHSATTQISAAWRDALSQRHERNVIRMRDMVEEARRINSALLSHRVTAAFMKGFTLIPDFCEDPSLRHQVDFDLLVAPKDAKTAAKALFSCGYYAPRVNETGETCFLTPLRHIPTANDDLYGVQLQRQVDLHVSLWQYCPWLPVQTPQDCLEHTETRDIFGLQYLGLSLQDKFLLQVFHAFHHSFRSWIRVSWLLELANCLVKHQQNVHLWNGVIARAGNDGLSKSIFAFVLGLVQRLFLAPIPSQLCSWTAEAVTPRLLAWLDCFAVEWAISDWPGSLNNLFLTADFIPNPGLRRQYWRSRFLPKKASVSLGPVVVTSPKRLFQLQIARIRYVACRAAVHLKDIAAFPRQQFRWRRALESTRRLKFDANC